METNTARVLARTAGRPVAVREAQERADALVPPGQGWAWNQALVDLGALGPVAYDRLADAAGWPDDEERARRVASPVRAWWCS